MKTTGDEPSKASRLRQSKSEIPIPNSQIPHPFDPPGGWWHNLCMRRRCSLAAALLLLLVLPVSAADHLHALERQVEKLRGLTFTRPVTARYVDGARMKQILVEEMDREYPAGQWPKMETVLRTFGLIPPKMDLRKVMTGLLEDQVAGLYDPRAKVLYVDKDALGGEDLLSEMGIKNGSMSDIFLVHELDHALTDQHFHLLSLPLEDHSDEDRASAARCVVEGDATWVMLRYMYSLLGVPPAKQKNMDDLAKTMGLGQEMLGRAAPAYVEQNLLMAYLGGLRLVRAAYARSGFAGVNALYEHPPQSMEEVLHPAKYFAGNDPPLKVRVTAPAGWKKAGWKELDGGTWGELNVRIILEEWGVSGETADRAAAGWGGDAYEVYVGPNGETAFTWTTKWDSAKDAEQFAAAARKGAGLTVVMKGREVTVVKGGPRTGKVPS